MKTKLIGLKIMDIWFKWERCVLCNDGCLYSFPTNDILDRRILKIDPSDDSTGLVGPILGRSAEVSWKGHGCIIGPDTCIYGYSCDCSGLLKYDPVTQEVSRKGDRGDTIMAAAMGANGIMYLSDIWGAIHRYDTVNDVSKHVGGRMGGWEGFLGAVFAGDGNMYLVPYCAKCVMRFKPTDESTTFIGDDYSYEYDDDNDGRAKWLGAVLGPDGNVYGIPCDFNYILKIDVANQTTSLVGPDLGKGKQKFNGGVVGLDNCIYMIPFNSEFVLKFNPTTGETSTVSEKLDGKGFNYGGGALASNGYIYLVPSCAEQVLKIKSWDNWLYLKPRLLVEQRRATRKNIQFDDDLNAVQHFIIHSNDDIFRTVLEMFIG